MKRLFLSLSLMLFLLGMWPARTPAPTYKTRSTTVVSEFGVSILPGTTATESKKVLTEVIIPVADVTGYLIGETVTETTSTETGEIFWISTSLNQLGLVDTSDEFTGGLNITGGTSTTVSLGGTAQNLLERTADTPIYTPLLHNQSITSTGVGDNQTVSLDANTDYFRIQTIVGATITVYNETTSYPLIVLPAGSTWTYSPQQQVQNLLLAFSAAGSCTVLEYEFPR
jgi:hypothetical protein